VRDITDAMLAFQDINQLRLELRCGVFLKSGTPVMGFELTAWEGKEESTEVLPLVCVKSIAGYSDRRTVEAVIFQLMYALDAELARREMSGSS
jgi:hypothetical protein